MAGICKNAFNLFVQLITIGDDDHPGVGLVFQYPLGQQHHHDALTAALCVPDDAAFIAVYKTLCRFDTKVLMHTRQLLLPTVKQHKIMNQL